MANPRENAAIMSNLLEEVTRHPMCAKFENTGTHYRIVYPLGDFPTDGMQVSLGMGKIKALQMALAYIERVWLASFPNPK